MTKQLKIASLALLAGLSFTATAAEQTDSRPHLLSFEQMDQNSDGQLSRDELKGPLAKNFDKLDTDGNGSLSKEELPKPSLHHGEAQGEEAQAK